MYKQIKISKNEKFINLKKFFLKKDKKKLNINLNLPLIIYGAGDMCKLSKLFFDKYKINPDYIIDKKKKFFGKKKVFKPSFLQQINFKVNICICLSDIEFFKVYKNLKRKKNFNCLHFYEFTEKLKSKFDISNGWVMKKNNIKLNKIKKILNIFEDYESKKSYVNFLIWHFNRNQFKNFPSKKSKDKIYFNNIIDKLLRNRVNNYLDLGSGHGQSIKAFLRKNYQFNKIISVEGDNESYIIQKKFLEKKNNIILTKKIISDKKKLVYFYDKMYHASKISKFGKLRVSRSIDSLNISPNIIKYHLEGEELNALKGSVNTIKKKFPVLLINIYHNIDGYYKIFDYFNKFKKKYRFYLRGYTNIGTGYVLYCVPKQ